MCFHKAERKRQKQQLNAIQPINFNGEKLSSRDLKRADAGPVALDSSVNWHSVGGLEGHVQTLKEMVLLPLMYPELFERLHVEPPRGVLFHGPPGTGKTLCARALANSCAGGAHGQRVAFFMRKGADCLSKWVGEAERQLRLLFDQAKRQQPSIIFFDEIDGLAPVRSSKQDQIHASIVSTLLALMDGLDSRGQVVVIGATNRPDSIDPALRRPGRFDRELGFMLPSVDARKQILAIHTTSWDESSKPKEPLLRELASLSRGYCGADLKALCTEASLQAVRRAYPQIYTSHEKLELDPEEVRISRVDFMAGMNKVVPAAHRSQVAHGSPLPPLLAPLLAPALELTLARLGACFRLLPNAQTHTTDSTAIPTAASAEDIAYVAGLAGAADGAAPAPDDVLRRTMEWDDLILTAAEDEMVNSSSDMIGSSGSSIGSSSGGLESSCLMLRVDSGVVHRPRFLLCGSTGMGQPLLMQAILEKYDSMPVISLSLPELLSETTASSPEEALVRRMAQARKQAPAILYLPNIELWWHAANTSAPMLWSSLGLLLQEMPSSLPVMLLVSSNLPYADIDPQILHTLFPDVTSSGSSSSPSSHAHYHELQPPEAPARREVLMQFAHTVLRLLLPSAERLASAAKRAVGKREEHQTLKLAPPPPPPPPDPMEEAKKLKQSAKREHCIREMRIWFDSVLHYLSKERRYQAFVTPVNREEVPDYFEVIREPMDLATMWRKCHDGEYQCLSVFMKDFDLIVHNAHEYNPLTNADRRGQAIVHAACNMRDNVNSMVHKFKKEVGWDLIEQCEAFFHRDAGSGDGGSIGGSRASKVRLGGATGRKRGRGRGGPAQFVTGREFKAGDSVHGNWKGQGKWYSGIVLGMTASGHYTVVYADGGKETKIIPSRLRRAMFETGQRVEVEDKSDKLWYGATIQAVNVETTYLNGSNSGVSGGMGKQLRFQGGEVAMQEGTPVQARFQGVNVGKAKWFPGKIKNANDDGSFDIKYDDGVTDTGVKAESIKPVAGGGPTSATWWGGSCASTCEVSYRGSNELESAVVLKRIRLPASPTACLGKASPGKKRKSAGKKGKDKAKEQQHGKGNADEEEGKEAEAVVDAVLNDQAMDVDKVNGKKGADAAADVGTQNTRGEGGGAMESDVGDNVQKEGNEKDNGAKRADGKEGRGKDGEEEVVMQGKEGSEAGGGGKDRRRMKTLRRRKRRRDRRHRRHRRHRSPRRAQKAWTRRGRTRRSRTRRRTKTRS
jgi:SpoVK/Ycf46/Vps4 family AAA+-type ATPase